MIEAKQTEGPWSVWHFADETVVTGKQTEDGSYPVLASVQGENKHVDAYLIAAAPDMRKMLKAIRDHLVTVAGWDAKSIMIEEIDAAITKSVRG